MRKRAQTKPVVFLSGPVGAGKTTVAKELVSVTAAPVAYIEGDTFWSHIAKIEASQERSKVFRTIMLSMTTAALAYARSGYETIVDFSIPPWFLPTALRVFSNRQVPLKFVVLRPSLEACALRAANRSEGVISDYATYKELYDSFGDAELFALDNSELGPAEAAREIRARLDRGDFAYAG